MSRSTSQASGPRPRAVRPIWPVAALALLVLVALVTWLASSGSGVRRAHSAGARSASGGSAIGRHGRHAAAARAPKGSPVEVATDLVGSAPTVPSDFLGLSFEVGELPRIASWSDHGDLVALMRALGPGLMRFGGVSVEEQATWASVAHPLPAWATIAITAKDLAGLARLAAATGWKVLLTINLSHPDPARAAEEAAAAKAALGSSLSGLALGNEPDQYVRRRLRTAAWSQSVYQQQVAALRAAVAAAAPGVPLAGPDAASGPAGLPWVRGEVSGVRPSVLTDHFYPSSSCGYTPVVSDLMAAGTRTIETSMLGQLAHISHVSSVPLRLDETNNISCRGQPGVSDSFASALWAVDYVARAIRAGLPGINFHDLVGEIRSYSPMAAPNRIALDAGALQAKPEYYALLLARALSGDQPLATSVAGGGGALTAMALRGARGQLHLVLVDFDPPGTRSLRVRLRVPSSFAAGTILRLSAPSPAALGGVRLGGSRVAADGTWTPQAALPRVYGAPGSLELAMAPSSAALVTLEPSG